jgi:hypothetical protein
MKEDLIDSIPETPVYTTRTIVISSFFGGVPAGCYMIYQNFKSFGDHKKAVATILLSIVVMIALISTAFIPAFDNIPGLVFTILTTLIISLLTSKYQGDLIKKHIEADGKIYSGGRALVICLISILIFVAFALGAFFLMDFTI